MEVARLETHTTLLAKCPLGTTLATAIQTSAITGLDIIEYLDNLPPKERWAAETNILDTIESANDRNGAVIHSLANHIKESKAYEGHLLKEQVEDHYRDIFERAD